MLLVVGLGKASAGIKHRLVPNPGPTEGKAAGTQPAGGFAV
jgi:hypothetical protein